MTFRASMAEREAWIALASTPGVGPVTFERLLTAFGDARTALEGVTGWRSATMDQALARRLGMRVRPGLASAIRRAAARPGRVLERMEALGGWVLTPLDAAYPARLHELDDPPRIVYGLGDPACLAGERLVAVVGTRRPSAIGQHLATQIAQRLAEAGVTLVSGLAVGIDGAAHRGALEAGGETIAVIGSRPDDPGPVGNRRLARDISATGAIVSELAPGIRATRGTYPRRNRIISALASATIVVEAPARSGAIITARHALEQGRQLLVAPGRPLDAAVAGNLALLRESPARPLIGLDEMIVDLDLPGQANPRDASSRGQLSASSALELLAGPERAVAESLRAGPRTVDALVRASGEPPGVVAAALTILQLRGWAHVLGALHLPAGPLLQDPRREAA
jgi:DNA processing protein